METKRNKTNIINFRIQEDAWKAWETLTLADRRALRSLVEGLIKDAAEKKILTSQQ